MMEARLTGVDRRDVLRYLGYRGGEIPEDVQRQIKEGEALLLRTARPRVLWRMFPLLPDGAIGGCTLHLQGRDLRALLNPCSHVILMAATLGNEAEVLLQRAQKRDMAQSVILDAVGSSAIEEVCNALCEDLSALVSPAYLTDRFSPGYGDFPLEQQAELCSVLDVTRKIGIFLSPGGMMIPQKSVTAVIGVSDRPQKKRSRGCAACPGFENCLYRKEGKSCGDF